VQGIVEMVLGNGDFDFVDEQCKGRLIDKLQGSIYHPGGSLLWIEARYHDPRLASNAAMLDGCL
jgi:hypothetical protein